MAKDQALIEKITSSLDNPNPTVLHALASFLETQESLCLEENSHFSSNGRASHNIGLLGNLVRENDEFFDLISSKFLSESRYSTSVQEAYARLLLSCSFTWIMVLLDEWDVLDHDYCDSLSTATKALMAASLTSRFSRVGRSLVNGLRSNFSNLPSTSRETACGSFLHQQQRTFIHMRTVLKVVDNSGARKVMCIQALKGKKRARLGDTIIASVKEAMPNRKVKKGNVVYVVVVRVAMQRGRCDGSEVKFDYNVVVLVDKQGQPIGTRVFGAVPHKLRQKKHVKILTLAEHIA